MTFEEQKKLGGEGLVQVIEFKKNFLQSQGLKCDL